jgi:hypothetical protein
MLRPLTTFLAMTIAVLLVGAPLAHAGWTGTVARVEGKGTIIVKADDGQENQGQMHGARVGDPV